MIRGETDHYDYVCAEAARGIQDVQLRTGVPCAFGVLTVENMDQALARTGGGKRDQGEHAAEAVLALAALARPRRQHDRPALAARGLGREGDPVRLQGVARRGRHERRVAGLHRGDEVGDDPVVSAAAVAGVAARGASCGSGSRRPRRRWPSPRSSPVVPKIRDSRSRISVNAVMVRLAVAPPS